jgi:hypothetical protein
MHGHMNVKFSCKYCIKFIIGHKELEKIISPKFFSLVLSAMRVINSDIQ